MVDGALGSQNKEEIHTPFPRFEIPAATDRLACMIG